MASRKPTSFDIAAAAGVSQPTVSRALSGNKAVSEETRRRVVEAAEKLNYKVDRNASNLRSGASKTIALLFFEDPTRDESGINPFYLSMLGALTRAAATADYDLLISFQQLSSDWHTDYEDSRKADGIILLGYGDYLQAKPRLEQLIDQGTHFVRWGATIAGQVGTTVGSDNRDGGRQAGRHLVARGCRRIAFLGSADAGAPEFLERYEGLQEALAEAGLEPVGQFNAIPTEDAGRAALAELLLDEIEIDGLFAASDLIAIGARQELASRGKSVPEDVALVGFDDSNAAHHTGLTSVNQDTRRAAEMLIDTLLAKLEDRAPESVVLPVELVVRDSA